MSLLACFSWYCGARIKPISQKDRPISSIFLEHYSPQRRGGYRRLFEGWMKWHSSNYEALLSLMWLLRYFLLGGAHANTRADTHTHLFQLRRWVTEKHSGGIVRSTENSSVDVSLWQCRSGDSQVRWFSYRGGRGLQSSAVKNSLCFQWRMCFSSITPAAWMRCGEFLYAGWQTELGVSVIFCPGLQSQLSTAVRHLHLYSTKALR